MVAGLSTWWVPLLLGALGAACVPPVMHVHVNGETPIQGGLGLEPGDRVIARWKDGLFAATVITVRHNLVTVAWDQPPPAESHVARAWVAPIAPLPGDVAVGSWAACADGESFV